MALVPSKSFQLLYVLLASYVFLGGGLKPFRPDLTIAQGYGIVDLTRAAPVLGAERAGPGGGGLKEECLNMNTPL